MAICLKGVIMGRERFFKYQLLTIHSVNTVVLLVCPSPYDAKATCTVSHVLELVDDASVLTGSTE